jgi:hypothetical protein
MRNQIRQFLYEEIDNSSKVKLVSMFVDRLLNLSFDVSYELELTDDEYEFKSVRTKPTMVALAHGDLVLYFPGDTNINGSVWGLNMGYYSNMWDEDVENNIINTLAAQFGLKVNQIGIESSPTADKMNNFMKKFTRYSFAKTFDGQVMGNPELAAQYIELIRR